MHSTNLTAAAMAFSVLFAAEAAAQQPAVQRGLNFVRANCARCHSIDKVSESPLRIAPPFRTLHLKYPIESSASTVKAMAVPPSPKVIDFGATVACAMISPFSRGRPRCGPVNSTHHCATRQSAL